jgi:hypothetical protein
MDNLLSDESIKDKDNQTFVGSLLHLIFDMLEPQKQTRPDIDKVTRKMKEIFQMSGHEVIEISTENHKLDNEVVLVDEK